MALFSERNGFANPRKTLQVDDASGELRTSLYNVARIVLGDYDRGSTSENICKELWTMRWHKPVDTFPYYSFDFYKELYRWVMESKWYVCYDLIEFIYTELDDVGAFDHVPAGYGYRYDDGDPDILSRQEFQDEVNKILETEGSGYRFTNGEIVPISNEIEIGSLEQSLSPNSGFAGARAHINQALKLLSKRPEPDYLNSVKESISAAESAAKKVSPGKNNTLADAVDTLRASSGLHKSLADSWKKMFGYTSDADGIRHAGSDEPVTLDFAFAKYMLVTCSTFVNYLAEEFGQDE